MAWTGLDTGGVEQLWDDELIVEVLRVLGDHSPFDRADEDADFYDELEELFPDITWRERDRRNSFRPIFRRANPWVKLGLVTPETRQATVTPLGEEVLQGETTLRQVYIAATKTFVESDGRTRSFARMCDCALSLPTVIFSLEDVEFAISEVEESDKAEYERALQQRRRDNEQFPQDSRRPRVLRRFMNSLVSAGALMNVPEGWRLANTDIAAEICGRVDGFATVQVAEAVVTGATFSANVKAIARGTRPVRAISPATSRKLDPLQRALLLEKAFSEHEKIVERCAELIFDLGGEPVEDLNSFDVACYDKPSVIFEAKSITASNCVSQLRRAISQLPEYRWRHRDRFKAETKLVIALNLDPRPYVDSDFLRYITDDRGLEIIWLSGSQVVDLRGRAFQEVLNR